MSIRDLKAEITRNDMSIPHLANKIGVSKKTLYSRINGETEFSQSEIVKISNCLNLSKDKIFLIFFDNQVS